MIRLLAVVTLTAPGCGSLPPDSEVNETGYMDGDRLRVTAEAPLAEESDSPVIVVGLAGAVVGDLALSLDRQPIEVAADGSFLALTQARLFDTLDFELTGQAATSSAPLLLEDPLDGPVPAEIDSDGEVFWVIAQGGALTVHLDLVPGVEEYVLFNLANGASDSAASGDVSLAGMAGDQICIAGPGGVVLCEIAVEPPA